MCVATAGRVKEIDRDDPRRAVVDFSGNLVRVDISLVGAKPGDWVLVHAGAAIEIVTKRQAKELTDLMKEIEELSRG
jgi:hydrogenase expression/formation protein HypC